MIVILPNNVDGLAALEKQLNTIDLQALSSGLKEHKVAVSLPKFKTSFSVTLNDALSNVSEILQTHTAYDIQITRIRSPWTRIALSIWINDELTREKNLTHLTRELNEIDLNPHIVKLLLLIENCENQDLS